MKLLAGSITLLAVVVLVIGVLLLTQSHHHQRACGNVFGGSCTSTNPFG